MKTMNAMNATSAVLALMIGSAAVAADDAGWYIGANAGEARATIVESEVRSSLLASGFTMTAYDEDERHFGYKVFGGYQFSRFFAMEGGYFDLGKFSFDADTLPAGSLRGLIDVRGANFDLVGMLPFTDRFSAFVRGGANYAEVRDTFDATGAVNVLERKRREKETHYKFGGGLQYAFTDSFAMRIEAERYRIDDAVGNRADLDLLSLGVLYRFGRTAAAPMPVADRAPVSAPPVMAPTPAPAGMTQYCSILDFQFEINRDDIQREEGEKLGVVGTFLEKYPTTTAVIEGHTDNIGTPEDNQRLSLRRAESVVRYLKDTYHIAASRLSAVGYGDKRPVGDNATEEGKRMNRRIGAVIACAPDFEGLAVKAARVTMALQMEFDRNKADVRPMYRGELERLAKFLKANPQVTATVEGHTGNLQATPELALEISQRRAQNVVNYLVDNFGIERRRLTAEGFGQTRRYAYNTSPEGQQENRRVNVIINYP